MRKQLRPAPESRHPSITRLGIIAFLAVSFLFYGIPAVFSITAPEVEALETDFALPSFADNTFVELDRIAFDGDDDEGEVDADLTGAGSAFELKTVSHTVRKGETISDIGSHYGISTSTLLSYNQLGHNTIKVGQLLKIPNRNESVEVPVRVSKEPKREKPSAPRTRRRETAAGRRSVWPLLHGRLTSKFGYRRHPISGRILFHKGIDLAAPKGAAVRAVKAGKVVFSGRRGGYGLVVDVLHKDGAITRYAHNSSLLVKVGSNVKSGASIAKVGSTGHTTGPHVHLEVIRGGERINPLKYLGRS